MRLNTFLCGVPLQQGVKAIGVFDIGLFLLEVVLAIFAGATNHLDSYFTLPVSNALAWIVVLKILIVDFVRVCVFGILLQQGDTEKRLRLTMGIARVGTQGLHVFLVVWSFFKLGVAGHIAKLIFNVALLLADVYFTAVIFSFYRTTTQEEIEIELKRLGEQRLDTNVYRLEDFEVESNRGAREGDGSLEERKEKEDIRQRIKRKMAAHDEEEVVELDHFRPVSSTLEAPKVQEAPKILSPSAKANSKNRRRQRKSTDQAMLTTAADSDKKEHFLTGTKVSN
jgi:hypothetical protein